MNATTQPRARRAAAPVYSLQPRPGTPPVSSVRIGPKDTDPQLPTFAHAHDFLALAYFEQGGATLRLMSHSWQVEAGDIYVIAPGELVHFERRTASGWGIAFSQEAIFGASDRTSFLSWRVHPLLFPFVRGIASGARRLTVQPSDRAEWSSRFAELDTELRTRQTGYQDAVTAHLTLLLIGVSRLSVDIADDLLLQDEPLLRDVFRYIEEHYAERISLKDVADALNLTSGYLTTLVRRKTGRPVGGWITERRMQEARRLLVETGLSVEEIGHRVGYEDPAYFSRCFRREHGVAASAWRSSGRP